MATADRSYRRYRWNDSLEDTGNDALLENTQTETISRKPRCISLLTCVLVIVAVVVLFLLGFCLGYYVRESLNSTEIQTFDCASYRKDKFNDSKLESVHERIMYFLSRDNSQLVKFVSDLGTVDPVSHSKNEQKLAQRVEQEFEDYAFDNVDVQEYNIITTFPHPNKPNHLNVTDSQGKLLSNLPLTNSPESKGGKVVNSSDSGPYANFPFVAYTLGGTAKGNLFYGHYGRESDVLTLKSSGLDPKGHILIIRLGVISVAEKLENAESAGASGVLLYWDPADREATHPHNHTFIPFTSAGSDNSRLFPLPTQTISSHYADWLLGQLRGDRIPAAWAGGFNFTYRFGKGNLTVELTTYNQKKEVFVRNVVGSLHGYSEPDSYVVIGAPRSSFPGSSTDALSSTAMLLEIARSLMYVQTEDQWKPRRGIKIISWGGAEFSRAGMREYIKANLNLLSRRAVAYLDLSELAIGNKTVTATVTPALRNLLITAARLVPNPVNPELMILEDWNNKMAAHSHHWSPFNLYTSDITRNPFLHMVGVPEIHLQFEGSNQSEGDIDHMRTVDTHHHFKYHLAVSRVVTLAMLKLVDDYVLPYSLEDYTDSMHATIWQTSESLKDCSDGYIDLGLEMSLTDKLIQTARAFDDFVKIYRQKEDVMGIKSVNDVKVMFERIFVKHHFGKRYTSQHMLYPARHDETSIDSLLELCKVASQTQHWDIVEQFQEKLYSSLHENFQSLRMN